MKCKDLTKTPFFKLVSMAVIALGIYSVFFMPKCSDALEFAGVGWHSDNFYSYTVDPKSDDLRFVWRDSIGDRFASIGTWKEQLESDGKQLVFAMNGGMYEPGGSPKGLYIEKGRTLSKIDLLESGYGNFYLQPNGVLFITDENEAGICETARFNTKLKIKYATQSGPMPLIGGEVNNQFRLGSDNKNIRNGVGLLEDGSLIFAMSKTKVNFHDFATFFKKNGCKNALYLESVPK